MPISAELLQSAANVAAQAAEQTDLWPYDPSQSLWIAIGEFILFGLSVALSEKTTDGAIAMLVAGLISIGIGLIPEQKNLVLVSAGVLAAAGSLHELGQQHKAGLGH